MRKKNNFYALAPCKIPYMTKRPFLKLVLRNSHLGILIYSYITNIKRQQ